MSAAARVALAVKLISVLEERGVEVPQALAEELMTVARDFDKTQLGAHFGLDLDTGAFIPADELNRRKE